MKKDRDYIVNTWHDILASEGLPLSCNIHFLIQNKGVQAVFLNNKAIRVSRKFRVEAFQLLKPSPWASALFGNISDEKILKSFVLGVPVSNLKPFDQETALARRRIEPVLTGNNSKSRSDYRLNNKHHIRDLTKND